MEQDKKLYSVKVRRSGDHSKPTEVFRCNDSTLAGWVYVGAMVDGNVVEVEQYFKDRLERRCDKQKGF